MGRLIAACHILKTSPPALYAELAVLLHEMNQPLTAIQGNAQAAKLLLSGTSGERAEMTEILDDIVTDNKRAAAIVKRLSQVLKSALAAASGEIEEGA